MSRKNGQLALYHRVPRRSIKRFLRQCHELFRMKAGSQPPDTPRGHHPVCIATCTGKKLRMLDKAGMESAAQFRLQHGIVTGNHCQIGVKGGGFVGHSAPRNSGPLVKAGFLPWTGVIYSRT